MLKEACSRYSSKEEMLQAIDAAVIETDVVLDLGCGIVPNNYFRPKLHIMVEPWPEYADILTHRHHEDKSVLVLKCDALDALRQFQNASVDTIFLLDVIEHLEKERGMLLITEMERVARQQIVVFTPLGFMPQHVESGEPDGWGLSGTEMQEHKSGWLPEDFPPEWTFHICEKYHDTDFRGMPLEKPYGAFFAIRTFTSKAKPTLQVLSDIRRPLPSEIALEKAQAELAGVQAQLASAQAERAGMQAALEGARKELEAIKSCRVYRLAAMLRSLLGR